MTGRIYTRDEWGARYGDGGTGRWQRGEIVAHTAAGGFPGGTHTTADDTFANEARLLRNIENFHVNDRGWDGIAYSFLVAPSGRAYEGRGWGQDGSHTETRNSSAYAICFLGHGDQQPATLQAWEGAKHIIRTGLAEGALTPGYIVTGHRDYSRKGKSCPGDLIYPHIGRLRGLTIEQEDDMPLSDDDIAKIAAAVNAATTPAVDRALQDDWTLRDGIQERRHNTLMAVLNRIANKIGA